ncbi:MAG: insulinase family protein [Nanoarchaeota archaeon]|nr:insulinase family protein [Nanoarchaeota archaeon]
MKFQKKRLKNGMTVLFEKRDLPLVSLSISNPFGGAYEKSGEKGIAHLIEHLVFTGTKTRSHEDISREIEKKGGILNAFTAQDLTSFWFKLPSEHVFSGLDILIDILENPKFDEVKFEKEKKVVIEEIKMYHDNPIRRVNEMIEENLYKKPFGEGIAGSAKTVSNLKHDFVVDYFKKMYNPRNYIVTVVGNVDFVKICNYLEKSFRSVNGKNNVRKIVKQNKESVEKRQGIDQAQLVVAFHAPLMSDKKYYDLQILDAYLAHGMSSKLFLEIREKRGLAYTVRGSINTEENYSYYSIYVGTTKEAVKEVKKLILEGLQKVSEMTENDLKESKDMLAGLYKVHSEESVDVMNGLVYYELVTRAEEFYEFEKRIRKVKLEDVKKLAKGFLKQGYASAMVLPK